MLESYLKDGLQYIKIEKVESEKKNVKCGVPQGSILGPLLFIIYLNDIPTLESIEIKLYFMLTIQLFVINVVLRL